MPPFPTMRPSIAPSSAPSSAPSIAIVTVNWNSGDLLRHCVESLPAAITPDFVLEKMVIVDNASTDDSANVLKAQGVPLTVLRNTENRGFAFACNQGAALAQADYLLFLNPDTRLLGDSLAPALGFMEDPANARVGILGIRLIGDTGEPQRSCAREPTPGRIMAQAVGLDRICPGLFPPHFMSEWDHADTRPVEQVMGAFLIIRRSLFEFLGGFDDRFFVYFDDVDLCLRARQAGWSVVHFAGAQAFHRGGGTTDRVRDRRLFYALHSRILFARKHFHPLPAAVVTAVTLTVEPMVRLLHALTAKSPKEALMVLRGAAWLWRALPGLMARRPQALSKPLPAAPAGAAAAPEPTATHSLQQEPDRPTPSVAAGAPPSLDIIIVNWNAGRQLRDCLQSIVETRLDGVALERVVVIDNASMDGSADDLDVFALPLHVVRNRRNVGFGYAINQGAADSAADLLLFLNPDARLLPDSLQLPARVMADPAHADVGVVGVQLLNDRNTVSRSCARFPSPGQVWQMILGLHHLFPDRGYGVHMSDWDHASTRDVDHVIGAFYLIRHDLFRRLGGFDTRFFAYFEDVDLSRRVRGAGHRILFLAEARAYHRGGGTARHALAEKLYRSLEARIIYGYKHFDPAAATLLMVGTVTVEPALRLLGAAARLSGKEARLVAGAFGRLWRALPCMARSAARR